MVSICDVSSLNQHKDAFDSSADVEMQLVLFLHWPVLNVSVFHAAAVTSEPLSMVVPRQSLLDRHGIRG